MSAPDLKALTIRIPDTLHRRIMVEVEKRQATVRRYSMSDWLAEACREKLDGSQVTKAAAIIERTLVPDDDYAQHKLSAAEIAARIPGVRKGI